jgi:hypothetical protein
MRFLTKFYSFIKSIYLNNSKYSNNLRHTLRIFFEREVKTKHTPTLFGTTFKGSKWVDYQTFNINKVFIKSGLSYFYYIFIMLVFTFIFLGRSKSEQYFGFLPFFSYINFILGYVPILLGDLTSQFVILFYLIYNYIYQILYRIVDTLFLSIVDKNKTYNTVGFKTFFLETKYAITPTSKGSTPPYNIFYTKNNSNTSFLSKALSYTNYSLTLIDKFSLDSYYNNNSPVFYQKTTLTTTLIPQNQQTNTTKLFSSLASKESFYNNSLNSLNTKINTKLLTLNYLNKFFKESNHNINFNFNLKENLNIANQQRWLTRNSLLTESLVSNTFLITQVKKLIGNSSFDKDFTKNSLWLPTQSSKLSTTESHSYFNNLVNSIYKVKNTNHFLKHSSMNSPNFLNLNFFENSRLFLVKKYFFTTNISNNIVVNTVFKDSIPGKFNKVLVLDKVKTSFNVNYYKTTLVSSLKLRTIPSVLPLYSISFEESKKPTTLIYMNTSSLDILGGSDSQFYFIATSNLNNLNSTPYYNYVKYLKPIYIPSVKDLQIKFYKN